MLARILTENKDYQDVLSIVNQFMPSYTIIKADGVWHAVPEHSLIIEIDMDVMSKQDIESVAHKIKKLNKQQAVLVQYLQCESKLI